MVPFRQIKIGCQVIAVGVKTNTLLIKVALEQGFGVYLKVLMN